MPEPESRILTFDLEIARPIESHPDGWEAARRGDLGISWAVVWDSQTGRPHMYDRHRLKSLASHLQLADLLVGWNIKEFDIPCVEGITKQRILPKQYDILQHIWAALGTRYIKGYRLGDVAERTLGLQKLTSGGSAPKMARHSRWGALADYCLNDVHLTRELFNHIVDLGYIIDINGEKLGLEVPIEEYA